MIRLCHIYSLEFESYTTAGDVTSEGQNEQSVTEGHEAPSFQRCGFSSGEFSAWVSLTSCSDKEDSLPQIPGARRCMLKSKFFLELDRYNLADGAWAVAAWKRKRHVQVHIHS
jgi:hypothetical protein